MKHIQHTNDSWNATLYDTNHSFVSKFGNDVVHLLNAKKGEHILDLGCGTGDLAHTLYNRGIHVIGIDKSENMVQQAKQKYPHITFIIHDAINLDYHHTFDAVFSNATLHWVKPPKQALYNIYTSLKPGGRFIAEFGGKGNVQTITTAIMNEFQNFGIPYDEEQFPWYFPSIAEYTGLMEEAGFRVAFAQHFDRPTALNGEHGLRNWILMFANSMFEGIAEDTKEFILTKVENNLKEILCTNGRWVADYKRIRVIGVKE